MRQLLYVSSTRRLLSLNEMDHILTASRRNNPALGITGLLVQIESGFLHMLEGEERALRDLYTRICCDPRHSNVHLLLDRAAPRAFGAWAMGFEKLDGSEPETAGMFGVAREAIEGRLSPSAGKVVATMLETFYRVEANPAGLFRTA